MSKSIITLTTDFGLADHFVGTMKGVILGLAPEAQVVDISHEVTPFDIAQGGFLMAQAWKFFPPGTVHVVVVDPGVGTSRRPILAEAAGHRFVAPDNGVLSMVYSSEKHTVRAITAEKYFLQPVSRTFHGRDIFAPVAAHLARGARPASFGKRIDDYLKRDFERPVRTGKRAWTGTVLHIDHFGNLITNYRLEEFPQLSERRFVLAAGFQAIERLVGTYGEGERGELVLIEGSSGFLEISLDQAPAAKILGCGVGAPLELTIY
jgi:S-adenosylmethionine hydrolase